jgi:hypothetical protein
MKGIVWLLGLVMMLFSCAEFSDTEMAGTKEVHELYQGKMTYGKNHSADGDFFWITLSDTEIPLELDNTMEIAANNIGLIMYQHFTPDERTEYDWIKVMLETKTGNLSRIVSMGLLNKIWNMEKRSRNDLELLYKGDYSAYYTKLKTRQQQQFTPAVFDSLLANVFAETGSLSPPIEMGIDTLGYRDTIIGTYYFVFKSDIDSTPRLMYRASYLLTDNDSIIDFGLQSLLQ